MNKYWIITTLILILLAGCSDATVRRVGEALIEDRSPATFHVNAVRPIFNCANSPDPRYPCQGMGPEGFVRDLVAKPFANKRVMDVKDEDREKVYRVQWTWFSMQGSCDNPRGGIWDKTKELFYSPLLIRKGRSFTFPMSVKFNRLSPGDERNIEETGLTRLSAEHIDERWRLKHGESRGPIWPPQPLCSSQYMDLAAGSPFNAWLTLYVPDPTDKPHYHFMVKAPKHSKFETGCREEKRNGLTWSVCLSAGKEWPGGPSGFRESQTERWRAHLGDSGFVMQIDGMYIEPLYLWPQWYAERRAGLLEVIDSVRFENLSMPYDLARPTPVNSSLPSK